jgi:imidazole glycerol phosphate synthase, glutamine amidotransferase subunit
MKKIGIIDYGMGNLHSVSTACNYLGIDTLISSDPDELSSKTDALILPGVGAFPDAMERLIETGMFDYIKHHRGNKPLLGICLGMQLLFDESCEVRKCGGLGLIAGKIVAINAANFGYKVPHMGWNKLHFTDSGKKSPLLKGITADSYAYFVHSFMAVPQSGTSIFADTEYGEDVCAVVGDDESDIYGTQFHPEKSGKAGMQILRNFTELVK